MKINIKGIIQKIETKQLKESSFVQVLFLRRPERLDDFGEVIMKEQIWEIQNYINDPNKQASKILEPEYWPNKKVEIEMYLNSQPYEKEPGKVINILNLSFFKMTEIKSINEK